MSRVRTYPVACGRSMKEAKAAQETRARANRKAIAPLHPTTTFGSATYRVRRDGGKVRVEIAMKPPLAGWHRVTAVELRKLPVDGDLWIWLAAHGVERKSRSGSSGPSGKHATRRTYVQWPDDETHARVVAMCEGAAPTPRTLGRVIAKALFGGRS